MPGKPDLDYYKFKVYNGKQKLKSFYLEDLEAIQKDKQHSVVTTVGCAGLRRAEFKDEGLGQAQGSPWNVGAIGNAKFTGILVLDLLKALDLDLD